MVQVKNIQSILILSNKLELVFKSMKDKHLL
jgi:hypothetical protein